MLWSALRLHVMQQLVLNKAGPVTGKGYVTGGVRSTEQC